MRIFTGAGRGEPLRRSNAAIARDFMELSFQLESGRTLPVFTRFEGPVTVRLAGTAPASLIADLDRLIARLRAEAGIQIRRIAAGEANITISTITRAELHRHVPQAACFVSPRISSWDEFRLARNAAQADWTTLRQRDRMVIVLPWDVAPQEARDCLHEEMAQALGPLNDLYRLPGSVFNDDNFHAVLTDFDMLILRMTYAPELRSGMEPQVVAAQLPALLARLNPGGGPVAGAGSDVTPRAWSQLIETAIGPSAGVARRRSAASGAITFAKARGWADGRLGFAYYVYGRLMLSSSSGAAMAAFHAAEAIYRSSPEYRVQWAHVALQLVANDLLSGAFDRALALTDQAIPIARAAENAALLAQLMLMRAAALEATGRAAEAASLRREGLGWARYGFGSDQEVRMRAAEIAQLVQPRIAAR